VSSFDLIYNSWQVLRCPNRSLAFIDATVYLRLTDISLPDLQPSCSPVKRGAATFLYGQLTNRVIGCATTLHQELGPGFLESLYEEAFCAELSRQNLVFLRQRPVRISYKGLAIGTHRLDVVVEQKVTLELKAVKAIDDVHLAVMISYLKASRYPLGLIVNFSAVKTQIRRLSRELTRQHGEQETGEQEYSKAGVRFDRLSGEVWCRPC